MTMTLIFRLLLLAYPPSLRREYGVEMTAAIAQQWRDRRSLMSRVRLLGGLVGDSAASWRRRRPLPPMRNVSSDLRDAFRLFRRAPLFALGAVTTLALGIGASTAILSLADSTLLRPLPIPHADQLVQTTFSWSHPDFRDAVSEQRVFASLGAWGNLTFGLERDGTALQINGLVVSGRFFETTGQHAVAGRLLDETDDRPGAPLTAVVSERLWDRTFHRDPALIGRTVTLNRQPVTIVGVAPAAFRGLSLQFTPEVFVPVIDVPLLSTGPFASAAVMTNRGRVWLNIVGRLSEHATMAQAGEDLQRIYYSHRSAPADPDRSAWLVPVLSRAAGGNTAADLRRFIVMLLSATGVTLLLTCATVANLLLVRSEARRHELAVRVALGAGRARLTRLLFVESLGIGVTGGLVGGVVAALTLRLLGQFALPGQILIEDLQLAVNPAMLLASAGLGIATSVIFGMAPLWFSSRMSAATSLRDGSRVTSRRPLRSALIGVQVALCVLLLGGSLAFERAIQHALSLDLGFRVSDTTITAINPSLVRYPRAREIALRQDVLDAIRAQPQFRAAGWALLRPLSGAFTSQLRIDGVETAKDKPLTAQSNVVSDGYFDAMGIPTLAGRPFLPTDSDLSDRVVVVSEAMAAQYWPQGRAIGGRISTESAGAADPKWQTVVGIVADIHRTIGGPAVPMLYFPASQISAQGDFSPTYLIVRANTPPDDAVRDIKATIERLDASVPISSSVPMQAHVNAPLMAHRLGLTLFMLFAGLSVLLTGFGLYAVVAAAVAQRSREIGIRLALGASSSTVIRLVIDQGAVPVLAGLLTGLAAAAASARLISSFMFSMPALTTSSVVIVIAFVGGLACLAMAVPTRRALAVDPTVALRSE
jgi:predicted permease